MRIAIIGSARFPIRQPFAGGLEAHTWSLVNGLRARGHSVTIFAGEGCEPSLAAQVIRPDWPKLSDAARADVSMTADSWMEDHHAYLSLLLDLAEAGAGAFDLIHNNCLHHLPTAMARLLPIPMIVTLHTPPTPWLESAIQAGPCPARFAAVSASTARAWHHLVQARVVPNGVDLDQWRPGPGGDRFVWTGRLVHEKGPDLAIAACRRFGLPLDLAGPISDAEYFANEIEPALGGEIRYLGHLSHGELADVVGAAAATLVTPRWDEPYGLVAAESLACGTPVAGFAKGGLTEFVDRSCGVLVPAGDVAALGAAAMRAATLPRAAARQRAETTCSVDRMIDAYVELYQEILASEAA
jgi:glycosyltransferase involved in cell wall biosynthesis